MAQVGWILDLGKCVGCRACVVSCKMENNTPTALNYRWVIERESGSYPTPSVSFVSMGCYHCVEPACMSACPVGCITKRSADGIVLIDEAACIGCRYCMAACPHGAPQFNAVTEKVEKCTYCVARADASLGPACARTCVGGAITAVTDDTWGGTAPADHARIALTNAAVKFLNSAP